MVGRKLFLAALIIIILIVVFTAILIFVPSESPTGSILVSSNLPVP